MYKAQIDLAAESHEMLIKALETTVAMIRSGQTSGADLLADGLAEYDFLVQTPRSQPHQPHQQSTTHE